MEGVVMDVMIIHVVIVDVADYSWKVLSWML